MGEMDRTNRKLIVLAFLLVAIAGFVWWRHELNVMPTATIPTPRLPSPNAFDYYVRAGNAVVERQAIDAALAVDPSGGRGYSRSQKAALLSANANALRTLREGFRYHYVEPPARSFSHLFPHYAKFRNLARLLRFEAQVKASTGDTASAMGSCLDTIKLGEDLLRGAPIMGKLISIACEAIGRREAWSSIDRLNALQARRATQRLEAIALGRVAFADTLREEMWFGQASLLEILRKPNWRSVLASFGAGVPFPLGVYVWVRNYLRLWPVSKRRIFNNYTNYVKQLIANAQRPYAAKAAPPPIPNDPFNELGLPVLGKGTARFKHVANQTQNDLLLVALALCAFRLERGRYPATLAELVPAYLKTVPEDPFALKGEFRYRRAGRRYVLYSVGPDSKDDGGTPIMDALQPRGSPRARLVNQTSKGDIVAGVNVN